MATDQRPLVEIPLSKLSRFVAEHEAAKEFITVYFNPLVSGEEKYDAAVKLAEAVKLTMAAINRTENPSG